MYYGQNLRLNDIFPYAVNISGIKKVENLVNLINEDNYNSQINFPYCTMGNYSTTNPQAIDGIKRNLPNFIPAGIYTKLSSDGFDVNLNNRINIDFPYAFMELVLIIMKGEKVAVVLKLG